VVGPTATGKSELGLALALALDGEVVNADAMQLYRGMDIGTAKLPLVARQGVPHHQLDVLDVAQDASLEAYQRHARADLDGIEARGRRGLVVGGSGLYVRTLLDRMDLAPTDPEVRSRLEAAAAERGPGALHDDLQRVDPAAAATIGRGNTRRIVRALEVIELTGRPLRAALPEPEYLVPTVQVGLDCSRPDLDARIAARVARMWASGLVEEVRGLTDRMGRTAERAVGYAQVRSLLLGEVDDAEAREATVIATRRLARRQMGWFGRDPRVHWLDANDPDLVPRAVDLVAAAEAGRLPEPGSPRRRLGS
jgi:tRNA dimethylallyltransferase